ncbi:hypothetical protein Tco_1161699, partial [Tanacetum coccineum]
MFIISSLSPPVPLTYQNTYTVQSPPLSQINLTNEQTNRCAFGFSDKPRPKNPPCFPISNLISAASVCEGLLPSPDMLSLPLEFVATVARAFYLCVEDFIFILKISGSYSCDTFEIVAVNILIIEFELISNCFHKAVVFGFEAILVQEQLQGNCRVGYEARRICKIDLIKFESLSQVDYMQGVVGDYRKLAGVKTIAQEGYPQAELSEDPRLKCVAYKCQERHSWYDLMAAVVEVEEKEV